MEGVGDHIVSSLHGKVTPYEMWKSLIYLFLSSSDHRKLALKDKLRKIKMEKGNTIPVYLTKFLQCQDELGSVGIIIADDFLVSLALLGLPKSWQVIRTLPMGGKSCQIGNDFGQICCKKNLG